MKLLKNYNFFLGLYPLLNLISSNSFLINLSSFYEIILLIFFIILLIITLEYLINFFLQNLERTRFIVTLLIINFYLIKSIKHVVIGFIFSILIYLLIVVEKKKYLINFQKFFSMMALILFVFPCVQIIYFFAYKVSTLEINTKSKILNEKKNSSLNNQRDIFYIVLDGYGGSTSMKKYLQFDNKEFLDFLKKKNFYVNDNSNSNYNFTNYSIPATLNMNYLSNFGIKIRDFQSFDQEKKIIEITKNNLVKKKLEKLNYDYIMVPSRFSESWVPENSNFIWKNSYIEGDILRLFLNNTILIRLKYAKNQINKKWVANRRQEIIRQFNFLKKDVYNLKSSKFVFVHILSPHPPYVFTANGDLAETNSSDEIWDYPEEYINQIQYLNKEMKIIIDNLIEKSKTQPIIIIESDHGPSLFAGEANKDLTTNNLRALYFPGLDLSKIDKNMTSVNIFRFVFQSFFDKDTKLIEDKVFYLDIKNNKKEFEVIR